MRLSDVIASQDKLRAQAAKRARQREWRIKNRDKIAEKDRSRTKQQRDRKNERQRMYYANLTVDERKSRVEKSKVNRESYTNEQRSARNKKDLDARLKRTYGIGVDGRIALLMSQGGVCAICRCSDPGPRGWDTDHCHASGKVRGILCPPCNKALGYVKDDVQVLKAMIDYLNCTTEQ